MCVCARSSRFLKAREEGFPREKNLKEKRKVDRSLWSRQREQNRNRSRDCRKFLKLRNKERIDNKTRRNAVYNSFRIIDAVAEGKKTHPRRVVLVSAVEFGLERRGNGNISANKGSLLISFRPSLRTGRQIIKLN